MSVDTWAPHFLAQGVLQDRFVEAEIGDNCWSFRFSSLNCRSSRICEERSSPNFFCHPEKSIP